MDLYDALLFRSAGSNFQSRLLDAHSSVYGLFLAVIMSSADKLRSYSIEHRCTSVARITWIR